MTGLIAIVGRPNVGKSALFNRIAGRRIAIVHDRPGVTRDRVMADCEWDGHPFSLVDTGGIGILRGERAEDRIVEAAFEQVQIAIESANVILFVVNVQEGIVPLDAEVAIRLREAGKPVLMVVNKADHHESEAGVAEFTALGFPAIFPVSAIHNRGIDDLMEAALTHLPPPPPSAAVSEDGPSNLDDAADEDGDSDEAPRRRGPVRLAIVGRPNVGKSSIINALTGSERVIVSPVPGTTRDAVDVPFEVETDGVRQAYVLVDTAGLRKARKVEDTVEFFSTERTREAVVNCDIAILVLDAETGIVEQDKKIADLITSNHRACILVVNKWDLVAEGVRKAREEELERRQNAHRDDRRKRLTTLAEFGEWVQEKLFFLDYAPVIFTSATEGFQLDRLLEAVRYVGAQLRQHIPTAILNRTLRDAVERRQPISQQGHRLKFFYATQTRQQPPTFLLFLNRDDLLNGPYEKYLGGELRKAFGFEGCPLMLVPKARPKTIEPVRKYRTPGTPVGQTAEPRGAARKALERKLGKSGRRLPSRFDPTRAAVRGTKPSPAGRVDFPSAGVTKPVAFPKPVRPAVRPSGRPTLGQKPSAPPARTNRGKNIARPSGPAVGASGGTPPMGRAIKTARKPTDGKGTGSVPASKPAKKPLKNSDADSRRTGQKLGTGAGQRPGGTPARRRKKRDSNG